MKMLKYVQKISNSSRDMDPKRHLSSTESAVKSVDIPDLVAESVSMRSSRSLMLSVIVSDQDILILRCFSLRARMDFSLSLMMLVPRSSSE
jgi:hypothetical protein